jgi:hypothetical protein
MLNFFNGFIFDLLSFQVYLYQEITLAIKDFFSTNIKQDYKT